MDEVVQGGGALVIIHLGTEHSAQQGDARISALPLHSPNVPHIASPPPSAGHPSTTPHTHRPGQVTAHGLLFHQLQADVNVKLAAVLDILMAAQSMFAGGAGGQGHEHPGEPVGRDTYLSLGETEPGRHRRSRVGLGAVLQGLPGLLENVMADTGEGTEIYLNNPWAVQILTVSGI